MSFEFECHIYGFVGLLNEYLLVKHARPEHLFAWMLGICVGFKSECLIDLDHAVVKSNLKLFKASVIKTNQKNIELTDPK